MAWVRSPSETTEHCSQAWAIPRAIPRWIPGDHTRADGWNRAWSTASSHPIRTSARFERNTSTPFAARSCDSIPRPATASRATLGTTPRRPDHHEVASSVWACEIRSGCQSSPAPEGPIPPTLDPATSPTVMLAGTLGRIRASSRFEAPTLVGRSLRGSTPTRDTGTPTPFTPPPRTHWPARTDVPSSIDSETSFFRTLSLEYSPPILAIQRGSFQPIGSDQLLRTKSAGIRVRGISISVSVPAS